MLQRRKGLQAAEAEHLLAILGDPDLAIRATPAGTMAGAGLIRIIWKYRDTTLPKVRPLGEEIKRSMPGTFRYA